MSTSQERLQASRAEQDGIRSERPSKLVLYDTEQAAAVLHVSPRTMVEWRRADAGPHYVRYGKRNGLVFYRESDLLEFLDRHMVTTSMGVR